MTQKLWYASATLLAFIRLGFSGFKLKTFEFFLGYCSTSDSPFAPTEYAIVPGAICSDLVNLP